MTAGNALGIFAQINALANRIGRINSALQKIWLFPDEHQLEKILVMLTRKAAILHKPAAFGLILDIRRGLFTKLSM